MLVAWWSPLQTACVNMGTDEKPLMHIPHHLELARRNLQEADAVALGAIMEGACCQSGWRKGRRERDEEEKGV